MVTVAEIDMLLWNNELEKFNYGLFNTSEWVNSLSDSNYSSIFLEFNEDGVVIGKMAGFVLKDSRIKGDQLLFYSGPALIEWNALVFKNCLEALHVFAKQYKYSRIHVRPFDQHLKALVNVNGYFHTVTSEYIVEFDSVDKIKFSFGFKQNVKKAKKAGTIFFTSQSVEVLDRMLELMNTTRESRRNKYGPDYNQMYMVNLTRKSLSDLLHSGVGVLNCASIDGVIHSVELNVERGGKLYGLLMGSDAIAYKNGLASFIDWHIVQNANESGCQYYNLGLIPPENQGGAGIKRYKESVGAVEMVSYGYYSYYLTFPMILLNPLIKLSKKLPENKILNFIRSFLKK
jgi:lipid II:glycine glycyltransferase (peptidoglycan interpeptide bridge formation enzyme)